jgi:hypothetical protein
MFFTLGYGSNNSIFDGKMEIDKDNLEDKSDSCFGSNFFNKSINGDYNENTNIFGNSKINNHSSHEDEFDVNDYLL